jgi:hypothetical protein
MHGPASSLPNLIDPHADYPPIRQDMYEPEGQMFLLTRVCNVVYKETNFSIARLSSDGLRARRGVD